MNMKKIIGLDIGTNSIGWAFIELKEFGKAGTISALGSRIIPMDGDALQKFEKGNTVSKNADRRQSRMSRRLKQRFVLRRTRLITALKIAGLVPDSFPIDFKAAENENSGARFNINDFLPIASSSIHEAKQELGASAIPQDWVLYYLRHKALSQKITIHELVRIIYMMNQRRGFRSSRKDITEQEETDEIRYPIIEKWVQILTIKEITEIAEEKGKKVFQVTGSGVGGNIVGQIERRNPPDWLHKEVELEITKKTTKSGDVSYRFSLPDSSAWEQQKTALNKDIRETIEHGQCQTVGEYLFLHLKKEKNYRIRQRIVDRDLYQAEFEAIWKKQAAYHPELNDRSLLPDIAMALYQHNEAKRKEIIANDLFYLIANDIIYYQRPLKSQKHSIDFCTYEKKYDPKGNEFGIRVAPKSSPAFQEFRIWQTIHNLRVLQLEGALDGKPQIDIDVTDQVLIPLAKAKLFLLFDSRKEVTHPAILRELGLNPKTYRLNYPAEKNFTGNETKETFRKVFRKHKWEEGENLLKNSRQFDSLWHILYSLPDPSSITKALSTPGNQWHIPNNIIQHLSNLPDFPKQYAAYSTKAINKLLSLMRCGSYFDAATIDPVTKARIDKLITGEFDESLSSELRDKVNQSKEKYKFLQTEDFQGLPHWLAAYIIYGRHSEKENTTRYSSPDEMVVSDLIPNNSLRNPIVEQICKETISLVKSIWEQYGQPDEIHIELARDLRKTSEERKRLSDIQFANENDRKRIKSILRQLKNANPESLVDIEKLRIWEETGSEEAIRTSVKFSKEPTQAEIEKYKLWGEQNHISPYTGRIIPLSKLFTPEYEIEHIIPRSRFFDNSIGNKTICEAAVNDYKGSRTAREMIEEEGGRTITHKGQTFTLLNPESYIDNCKKIFRGKKRIALMREEIPQDFVERQVNDTRYITRKIAELLYPVTRNENGIVFTIGQITSELKDKWGLNRVWKEILKPRFERLEVLTGERLIEWDNDHNNIHFKKDYKRIDHRHHALDALVIACTMREHVRYLNTLNAADEKSKYQYLVKRRYSDFILPWETFTREAKAKLHEVIVSYKNKNRVITKGINRHTKWVQQKDGSWKKELTRQMKGKLIAIRRSMFKEPLGKITLREYKTVTVKQAVDLQLAALRSNDKSIAPQIADKLLRQQVVEIIRNSDFDKKEVEKFLSKHPLSDDSGNIISKIQITHFNDYAAKRVKLDESFTHEKIDKIPHAAHSWLARLLHDHLTSFNNKPEEAFKGEGLDILNKAAGPPINKVTVYEDIGKKIPFKGKLVEADKGSNLFFVIYESLSDRSRIINESSSVPLLEAIERFTNQLPIADEKPGYKTIVLSPNELVYVPEEGENIKAIDWGGEIRKIHDRIYKVVSFSKAQCFFIPHFVSKPLDENGKELGSNNKSERAWNGEMIKNVCVKIKVDRLGNIVEVDGRKIHASKASEIQ